MQDLPTIPKEKGEVLRSANLPNRNWYAISHKAKTFVHQTFEELEDYLLRSDVRTRRFREHAKSGYIETLAVWIAALINQSTNRDARGFFYLPIAPAHLKGTRLHKRPCDAIAQYWVAIGHMESVNGSSLSDEFEGQLVTLRRFAKRYRATVQFLSLAKRNDITPESLREHFCHDEQEFAPIRLREKSTRKNGRKTRGRMLPVPDTPRTRQLSAEVGKWNDYLSEQEFEGAGHVQFYRTFSTKGGPKHDFRHGGRIYTDGIGSFSHMKREDRRRIRINGERVAEVDVRASHLCIFYEMTGCSLNKETDPYDIPGSPRDLVKKVVVMTIGADAMPKRWPNGYRDEYAAEKGKPFPNLSAPTVAKEVLKVHPCLAAVSSEAFSWGTIQYAEAEAIFEAVKRLMNEHDVPALPVHDSLVIPESKIEVAIEAVERAYQDKVGVIPLVR